MIKTSVTVLMQLAAVARGSNGGVSSFGYAGTIANAVVRPSADRAPPRDHEEHPVAHDDANTTTTDQLFLIA